MAEESSDFIRGDLGMALLGSLVASVGAALLAASEVGLVLLLPGALFTLLALGHLGYRLSFPEGRRIPSVTGLLMVGLPLSIAPPLIALAGYFFVISR